MLRVKLYTKIGGAGRVCLRHSELESLRRFSEKRISFELRLKGQIIYMVVIKEEKVSFWERVWLRIKNEPCTFKGGWGN